MSKPPFPSSSQNQQPKKSRLQHIQKPITAKGVGGHGGRTKLQRNGGKWGKGETKIKQIKRNENNSPPKLKEIK